MDLRVFISPKTNLERLSRYLDELGHAGRMFAVQDWTKPLQATLFEAAKGFAPLSLDHFVPSGTPPLTEVVHHGVNTLAFPRHFQKRFIRSSHDANVLIGYNRQLFTAFTGPGYFGTREAIEPFGGPGEVVFDYTFVPSEKADTWPKIVPNSAKLGLFVYHGMVDVVRKVSSHIAVGRAQKKGRWMNAYFVLVREDLPGHKT